MTKGQIILAVVVQGGFILLTALLFFKPEIITDSSREPIMMIVGAWIVNVGTIINWFFGSSKGSSDKTALLSK